MIVRFAMETVLRGDSRRVMLSCGLLAAALAETVVATMSWLLHGQVTTDYMLTGGVTVVAVSLVILPLIVHLTERVRQAESGEKKLAAILEASPIPHTLIDRQGQIVLVNAAFSRTYGFSKRDIPTLEAWLTKAYPDEHYRQWVIETCDGRLATLQGTGQIFEPFEVEIRCGDGSTKIAVLCAESVETECAATLVTLFDISERTRSVDLLNESHHLLQSIIEMMPVRVYWKDRACCYLGCNTLFARDAGAHSPTDIIGKDDNCLAWARQAERYRHDDAAVLASGQPSLGFEVRQIAANGKTVWLRLSKVPLRNADGEIVGLLGVYEDITLEKQTLMQLQRNEEALKRAQQVSNTGSWLWYLADNRQEWSDEMYRIFALQAGMPIKLDHYLQKVHPDERQAVHDAISAGLRGSGYDIEHRILIDGQVKWVRACGELHFQPDGRQLAVGTLQDISAYKKVEQALQAMQERLTLAVQASNDGLWDWNLETDEVYYSARWKTMLGYNADELEDKLETFLQLLHPDDKTAVLVAIDQYTQGMLGEFHVEFRMRHKDDRWVHILSRGALARDAQGHELKPRRMVGTHFDLTQRKQMEAERELLLMQLRQSQKMEAIGQLTGGIAHDFNNILAAILGYTALALDRYVPDQDGKLAEYLREVQTAGERARDLIANMLTFSRGGQGGAIAMDPVPLVKEVVKTLRPVLPSSIELNAAIDESLPMISIDPVQLHQIVMNLAINARDAVAGAGRIDIVLRYLGRIDALCNSCHRKTDGNYVELSIADNGQGIPEAILHRIFDPFFTTKEVGKGSGMGLAVVHGIVHEQGGHILVESAPQCGTTLRVLFPIQTEEV